MLDKSKITLHKQGTILYAQCPFCIGQIPIDFEPNYNDNQVRVKGRCKKCLTYIHIRTSRNNIITTW